MTALQQVEQLLPTISAGEKAQIARWVETDLGHYTPGIEKTARRMWGQCLHRTHPDTRLAVGGSQKRRGKRGSFTQFFPFGQKI